MRILIVEDNPRIAGFLQKGLREEGYVVEVAADGDTAFDKATTQGFDAAVVDVMIPGRSGVELVRDLRDRERGLIQTVRGVGYAVKPAAEQAEAEPAE
jgi:DNA-binding response OmpR family regulator